MAFESEPMSVDTSCDENVPFDDFVMLLELRHAFSQIPDNSINLRLLIESIDMMDVKDSLAIKKTVGIPIPKELSKELGINLEDIQPLKTLSMVRSFKERVFKYGAWVVSNELVLGNIEGIIKLDGFFAELDALRKDWSQVANFKAGQHSLKTSQEVRDLAVYNIGGLDFTDSYEVMFLYLERNLIEQYA